jgi:hypothetical protein
MKLLTHNMLQCHIRGVKNGYPFKIEAKEVEKREAEFNKGEERDVHEKSFRPPLLTPPKPSFATPLPHSSSPIVSY